MHNALKDKKIILGVSGGIAAFKAVSVASRLVKKGCTVNTIMTKNAEQFVRPLTFETLTNRPCIISTFERNGKFDVEHVSLAKSADAFVIVPATANVIAKIAHGIADDMLTSTFLACNCKKIIFPAMNTGMFENVATKENINILISRGMEVIDPVDGVLACGDIGKGRLMEVDDVIKSIENILVKDMDLDGKNVLVTAGATEEPIDPVRFLTNRSSGKMGYAIADAAAKRGANVTLISGRATIAPPPGMRVEFAFSAKDMYDKVLEKAETADICILAAAVADYRPKTISKHKIKKTDQDRALELVRTPDILKSLGKQKIKNRFLCGFSMETEDLIENSKAKLISKKADMIIANNINDKGAGFCVDTNKASIITKDNVVKLPLMSKKKLADVIIDNIVALIE